jgi:hypothetical protein
MLDKYESISHIYCNHMETVYINPNTKAIYSAKKKHTHRPYIDNHLVIITLLEFEGWC